MSTEGHSGSGEDDQVLVAEYAQRCGVDEELIRTAVRRIASASSVAVFEDLGVQQAPNSTLCSYLNKMLWILTGNFAKPGSQHLHSAFAPLFTFGGVGAAPTNNAKSAQITTPPTLANNSWNDEGLHMTQSRYLLGSSVQSAFIFLVGGQTGTEAASGSTELVVW